MRCKNSWIWAGVKRGVASGQKTGTEVVKPGVNDEDLQKIREHARQERALGSPRFQTMVEKALGRPVMLRTPGRPRKEANERTA